MLLLKINFIVTLKLQILDYAICSADQFRSRLTQQEKRGVVISQNKSSLVQSINNQHVENCQVNMLHSHVSLFYSLMESFVSQ